MNDKLKKYLIPILLIILGLIITTSKVNIYGKKIVLLTNFIVLVTELIMFKFVEIIKNKNIKIHNIYLILAIVFGILYIFVFPPSEIPDEMNDYLRALEISKNHLVTKQIGNMAGDYYSKNILEVSKIDSYKDEIKKINLKLTGKKIIYDYANKSLYNFMCYIPQSIGIGISSLLNLSIIIQMIFGKILNYAIFVILIYFSIKYIPYKKHLVLFVSFLPITLQEAASLSPDALAISLSIFYISYILKIRNDNKMIQNKQMFILLIISILLSLCKIVYLPLCLLLLLIPKKLYNSKKKFIIYNLIVIGISTILNLVWLKYTSRYLVAFSQSNSSEQLKYILTNPISYFLTIINTLDTYLLNWLLDIGGRALGLFKIKTSILTVLPTLYIMVKLIVGEKNDKNNEYNIIEIVFILIMILSIIMLIFTSLYLQWTPLKSNIIEGIQGRYFIPLIIPISYIFIKKEKEKSINANLIMFIIFSNLMALLHIIGAFV